MRLGPWELRRSARAAAQPKVGRAVGASGTTNISGIIVDAEYNPALRGKQALTVYDRMMRSDGSVQEAVEHINAPIRNATWTVDPPEQPDDDELAATALVEQAYFEWLDQPWLEHIEAVLDFPFLGHAVFEHPWKVVEEELRVTIPGEFDIDEETGRKTPRVNVLPARQYLTFRRFAPRLQETIEEWHVEDGDLVSIVQRAWTGDTYDDVEIPAELLLVFTHRRRGDDFTGRPMLRAAYKPWTMKEIIEKVGVVAVERHGVGVPIAYPPTSASSNDQQLDEVEEILKNLRSGAFSYIVAPGPKAQSNMASADGWLFEILSPAGGVPDFAKQLEYHRAEIKAAVLARFSELGHANVGARATGDVQSIVWYAALHSVARYISDVHQTAIKRLVDANFEVSRYPRLNARDIETRNVTEFAEAVGRLVISGAALADEPFRSWVRQTIDAPEEAEIEEEPETEAPPDDAEPDTDEQGRPIEEE